MPREILSDNYVPDTPSHDAAAAAPAAQPPVNPLEQPQQRDALAGALPVWDLLPASPFVRRVK